jgi:hypothetical protein
MWMLISDPSAQRLHKEALWSLIPKEWQRWWLAPLKQFYELQNVTMKHPSPLFNEVSVGFHEFGEELKCLWWLLLVKLLDKYCVVPTVKCPWGCSAFLSDRVRRLETKNYFNVPYTLLTTTIYIIYHQLFPLAEVATSSGPHWGRKLPPPYHTLLTKQTSPLIRFFSLSFLTL